MEETERAWLVERTYTDKGMVTLVYATTDGERYLQRQLSEQMLARTDVTAGTDVEPNRLQSVEDADRRERFEAEASRMATDHDPEDPV